MSNYLRLLQRVGFGASHVVESNEYGLGAILKSKLLSKQFTSDDRYPVRVFPILGALSKELVVKLT